MIGDRNIWDNRCWRGVTYVRLFVCSLLCCIIRHYQKQCKYVYCIKNSYKNKYSTIVFIMASKRCKQAFSVTAQYLYLLPTTVDNYYKRQNYNIKEYCFNKISVRCNKHTMRELSNLSVD